MKITDERKPIEKTFGEVGFGDVFKSSGSIYMRIEEITQGVNHMNSVNLGNGFGCFFDDENIIIPLDAELIIRG